MARQHRTLAVTLLVASGALLACAGASPARSEPSATLLAPAIPEAARAGQPRGLFFTAALELDLPGEVRLASTPDGSGELCTDDEVELRFQRSDSTAQVWQHRFATPDRQGIQCIPAQTIALAAGPGHYTLAISLTDRFADTFSSGSYYLLAEPVAEAPAMIDDGQPATSVGRQTSDEQPTSAPTITVSRATATTTTTESAIASLKPTATTPPARSATRLSPWLPALSGIGVGLALLALALVLRRRRRPAPRLRGIVDLVDRETGETRTLLLHHYPHGVGIVRRPLDLVPLGKVGGGPVALATIIPGATGPLLEYQDPAEGRQHAALNGGDRLLIQRTVEVFFRRVS